MSRSSVHCTLRGVFVPPDLRVPPGGLLSFRSIGSGEPRGGGLPEGLPESMRVVRVAVEGWELTPESWRMLSIDGGTGGGMAVECE